MQASTYGPPRLVVCGLSRQLESYPPDFPAKRKLKSPTILETNPSGYLNPSSVVLDAVVDPSENRRRESRRRQIKRGMIRKILQVSPQIEADSLGNPESLRHRGVGLEIRRRQKEVAAGISDRACRRLRKQRARGSVEPEISSAFQHQLANASGAAAAIRRRLDHVAQCINAGVDGKRPARSPKDQARHLPSADDLIEKFRRMSPKPFSFSKRQFINVRSLEDMPPIEIGPGVIQVTIPKIERCA